ncbi:RING finger protein 121 [Daphnia magna]|uniref:RING finger protein 121 n=1 Tax=Daphnia magna TaxID=35525 RepID=A0A162CKQ3_9CRUS|nr:RING finger protein 121 [Daphnia magna]
MNLKPIQTGLAQVRYATPSYTLMQTLNESYIKIKEQMSEGMFVLLTFSLIFVSTALVVQIGIILWRKSHPRSFDVATFCALCLIPSITAFILSFWWFLILWGIFFSISIMAYLKARFEKPLLPSTPGLIFRWFYFVHYCSFVFSFCGSLAYTLGLYVGSNYWLIDLSARVLLYGVYFGLVGRDFAMHITDNLFVRPTYPTERSLLPYHNADLFCCSLCGYYMSKETKCSLSCQHAFHENCVRGWYMIGKKSTCPVCWEKVDYQLHDRNPWETPDAILKAYHDFIRWLVIYLPILITVFSIIYVLL